MADTDVISVMIVDDEPILVQLYTAVLEEEYEVRSATSGTEALEKIDDTFDIVLLDRRMPDLSGDEVLSELRNRELDCQVAMLTAVQPDTDIVDMPFDEYLTKPVGRDDLRELVETLIKRSTYAEQSQEYFRLTSKKAALELANKDHTDSYEELVTEMTALREELSETLDEIGPKRALQAVISD